jgi:spermidine synthase
MAQVEQALYQVVASITGATSYCKGAVLNVGLGDGVSARAFLWSPYVTRVTSVEISQPVIDTYRVNYPVNEVLENGSTVFVANAAGGRHNLRLGDAATIPANQINPPFDFAFIDTLSAYEVIIYNKLKDIATRLAQPGALTAQGRVCVQWQSDVQVERQARQWMQDNGWIAETVRPQLAYNGWARAAEMLVYHR